MTRRPMQQDAQRLIVPEDGTGVIYVMEEGLS